MTALTGRRAARAPIGPHVPGGSGQLRAGLSRSQRQQLVVPVLAASDQTVAKLDETGPREGHLRGEDSPDTLARGCAGGHRGRELCEWKCVHADFGRCASSSPQMPGKVTVTKLG